MPGVLLDAGEKARDTYMTSALLAFPFSRSSNLKQASRHSGNFRSRQETNWPEANGIGGWEKLQKEVIWKLSVGTSGVGAGS